MCSSAFVQLKCSKRQILKDSRSDCVAFYFQNSTDFSEAFEKITQVSLSAALNQTAKKAHLLASDWSPIRRLEVKLETTVTSVPVRSLLLYKYDKREHVHALEISSGQKTVLLKMRAYKKVNGWYLV